MFATTFTVRLLLEEAIAPSPKLLVALQFHSYTPLDIPSTVTESGLPEEVLFLCQVVAVPIYKSRVSMLLPGVLSVAVQTKGTLDEVEVYGLDGVVKVTVIAANAIGISSSAAIISTKYLFPMGYRNTLKI
ncbi:MAG: hypothetical protein V1734_05480 [Nanoarchaeota archaeon]